MQIYIILGLVPNSGGKVLPAVYCLLPGKSEAIYKEMWSQLKAHIGGDSVPDYLSTDMEASVSVAFAKIYEGSSTSYHYCWFHIRRATRQQIGQKGCAQVCKYPIKYYIVLCYCVLYCIVPYYIVLCCIVPYYIVLYCIVLYYCLNIFHVFKYTLLFKSN